MSAAADPAGAPERVGVARIDGAAQLVAERERRVTRLVDVLGASCPATTVELIERWATLPWPGATGWAAADALDPAALDWAPPVMPRKLICVGANYHDHVAEMARAGAAPAARVAFPFSFLKPSTALIGSGAPVTAPAYGEQLDWEAELAIVIGAPGRATEDPSGAIFGYTILDDLSLRDFVAPFPHPLGLDALISKGFDGAAPLGPWITRAAHVGDPSDLAITLRVNGELKQDSSTTDMIFSVVELVAYYARVLTLEPGDVIATGTPAGVGAGRRPPEYLAAGDEIEIEIAGLGRQRTPLRAAPRPTALAIRPD